MVTLLIIKTGDKVKKSLRNKLFFSKLIYTLGILVIYAVMRKINLYGVDVAKMTEGLIDADAVIGQIVGGDLYRCSITAIGFAPYMIAGIIVMTIQLCQSSDTRSRISPKQINRYTLLLTVTIGLIQAILRSNDLIYIYSGWMLTLAKFIVVMEMLLGTLLIIWLSMRNKEFGIGGQMALIVVNVLDGIMKTTNDVETEKLIIPLMLGLLMLFVMIFMENAEKRIPLQRISIHNIYADKNYQAIKFNPIGIMPVLFASAVLMLPQFVAKTLLMNMPDNRDIAWVVENMVLSRPLGIITYLCIIYLLNLLLTWAMINPKDLTESLQKSGDGIVGIRPGKNTKRYLRRNLFFRAMTSSTVLSICLGGALFFQMNRGLDSSLAMIPASIMMLAGLSCNLYREAEAIINMDSYKAFI